MKKKKENQQTDFIMYNHCYLLGTQSIIFASQEFLVLLLPINPKTKNPWLVYRDLLL